MSSIQYGTIVKHTLFGNNICSQKDEDAVFKNKMENDRFEVTDWEPVERYFPTQLSPNKQTIEVINSAQLYRYPEYNTLWRTMNSCHNY